MTETFTLPNGMVLTGVHSAGTCKGPNCTIHNPIHNHPMNSWPLHWRVDRKIFERICEHGIGHPDPSGYYPSLHDTVHGCDGCCHLAM